MHVADVIESAFGGEDARRGAGLQDVDVTRCAGDGRTEANVVTLAVGSAGEIPAGGVAGGEGDKGRTEGVADREDVDGLVGRPWGRHALVRATGGEDGEGEATDDANTHGDGPDERNAHKIRYIAVDDRSSAGVRAHCAARRV